MVTDGDPAAAGARGGDKRVIELLRGLLPAPRLANKTDPALLLMARAAGLFVGTHTCEADLFNAGAHDPIGRTLIELAPGPTARARAQGWMAAPAGVDLVQLLKDIEAIGKGRFAQRLCGRLTAAHCPTYIANAIDYVQERCR